MKLLYLLLTVVLFTISKNSTSQINSKKDSTYSKVLSCPTMIANAGPDQLICPAPGSIQIGTSPQSLAFTYFWDPQIGLSNPYISNPVASPINTTTYTLTTAGINSINNGNFEQGNTAFVSDFILASSNSFIQSGQYQIIESSDYDPYFCGNNDHTTGTGFMMLIKGMTNNQTNNTVWSQNVAVIPGNSYAFSAWFYSVSVNNVSTSIPNIGIQINGNILLTTSLPYTNCNGWTNVHFLYIPTTSNAFIEIKSLTSSNTSGNVFAIDDISLSCATQDDVTVSVCGTCPEIQLSGTIESCNYPPGNTTIIPFTQNFHCTGGDCGDLTTLESNFASGNEWYINDVLVSGSGNLTPNGYYNITPDTKKLLFGSNLQTTTSPTQQFKFQVKNISQGCNQLTTPTFVYIGWYPGGYPITFRPNLTKTVDAYSFSAGPGSIYTWSVPGPTQVTDTDPYTPEAILYFPSNIPLSNFFGSVTISNSPYCNGTYTREFNYSPYAFAPIINSGIVEKQIKSNLYPNPATNQINITSIEGIILIEIIDVMNSKIKRLKLNATNKSSINISDLPSGIYNCRITTVTGIENKKFIIKR